MLVKKILIGLLGVVLVFLASKAEAFCDHTFTVKGKVMIYDDITHNNDPYYKALNGVKVRIYNGPFHIQTTATNSSGVFSYTWDSCSTKLDLSIAFFPTSSKINVSVGLIPNYWKIKPSKKFNNASVGTYDFGTFYYGKSDSEAGRILKVFYAANSFLSWLKNDHDMNVLKDPGVISGHMEIAYPATSQNSWYTPASKLVNLIEEHFPPEEETMETFVHESGHWLQNLEARWYLNIPDYGTDLKWSYKSEEDPAVANLEGFATFIEHLYMAEHGFEDYEKAIEYTITRDELDEYGAVNHAAFYYDLYDSNEDEDENGEGYIDRCSIPLKEIMTVFSAHDDLWAFSIACEDMDDFIKRYEELFGDPPGDCDFEDLKKLNYLSTND